MPYYDYECTQCSIEFAAFQRLSDVPYLLCPDCGGPIKALFLKKQEKSPPSYSPDWSPEKTDVHDGWKERRKWKHGQVKDMIKS